MNGYELISIFCFAASAVCTISGKQADEQAICRTRDTSVAKWTCKRIADCNLSKDLLGSPQEYRCGFGRGQVKICCPQRVNAPKPPASTRLYAEAPRPSAKYIQIINQKCVDYTNATYLKTCIGGDIFGQEANCTYVKDCRQKTETLIVHGKEAEAKEFPHMALIGYGEALGNADSWNCGGSLISERFVLTAAHCATDTPKPAKWIGFGLLHRDLFKADVLNKNIFPIKKSYIHPEYKKPQANNDIALFELKTPLEFSAFIRPICLHTEPNIPASAQKNASIIGWGKTAAGFTESDSLLKATIAFLSTNSCKIIYASEKIRLQNGFDENIMICAGDTKKTTEIGTSRDTCQGDSGGPIQMNHKEECMYLQAGITSMGSDFCGDGTPAIYTRIYPYLEWIQRIVWPENLSRV